MKSFLAIATIAAITAPIANANPGRYDAAADLLYPGRQTAPTHTAPPGQYYPQFGQTAPPTTPGMMPVVPAPVAQQPAPAPVVQQPAPAPVVQQPPVIVVQPAPTPAPAPVAAVPPENSCMEGTIAGGIIGGAGAAAANHYVGNGDPINLLWQIPAGLLVGSMVGCAIDGG